MQQPKPPVVLPAFDGAADIIKDPPLPPFGGVFKLIGLLFLAGAGYVGWQVFLKPKPPDACQQALDSAASAMQANQFAQAKSLALGAVARCTGESQDRAKIVLNAAGAAQAADDNCGEALRRADSQIADGRLKLALRTLDAQPGACLNREDAIARKQRIDSNKATAAERLSQAQSQLSGGQFDQARTSVDEAERLERDNADLSKIRKEIEAKTREAAVAKAPPAPPPQTAPVVPIPAPATNPPVQAPQPVDSAENNKRLECAVLVRAGQRALANKSYDEAMQSAQEARAAFANCSGAQDLFQNARQAKDKARQAAVIQ